MQTLVVLEIIRTFVKVIRIND